MIVSIFLKVVFMKAMQEAKLVFDGVRYDINAAQEMSEDTGPGIVNGTCSRTQVLRLWARARLSKDRTISPLFDATYHFYSG